MPQFPMRQFAPNHLSPAARCEVQRKLDSQYVTAQGNYKMKLHKQAIQINYHKKKAAKKDAKIAKK